MYLESLPDEVVRCHEECYVRLALIQLGIHGRLDVGAHTRGNVLLYFERGHPTHWLLFLRFWGFITTGDNGYSMYGLPKSDFSCVEAQREIEKLLGELEIDGDPF